MGRKNGREWGGLKIDEQTMMLLFSFDFSCKTGNGQQGARVSEHTASWGFPQSHKMKTDLLWRWNENENNMVWKSKFDTKRAVEHLRDAKLGFQGQGTTKQIIEIEI